MFESLRNNNSNMTVQEEISEELVKQFDDKAGFRLRFPDETLEQEFRTFYAKRYRGHVQIGFYLILLFFLSFGVLDYFYNPDIYSKFLKLRLFIAVPLFFIYWFISSKKLKYQQLSILIFLSIFTIGTMRAGILSSYQYKIYIYSLIILLPAFTYVITRLFFKWALFYSIFFFISSIILWCYIDPLPLNLLGINLFLLFSSIAFSLTATFLIERVIRKIYLESRTSSFQKQDLQEANVRLKYLIALDGLTGIANRRTLDETLASEWQRALRNSNPISILMMDIDHFKQYNDTYGHQAGDSCLKEVSKTLKAFARRPGDLAARYGGEEFSVILSNTELIEASIVATRILQAIQSLKIPHAKSSVSNIVTLSIGIAVMVPDPNCTPYQLVANADKALYCAKSQGRNRVAIL